MDGQETVITEREVERLRFYLPEAFDGVYEESRQDGEGKEEQYEDPDETEDEESGQGTRTGSIP